MIVKLCLSMVIPLAIGYILIHTFWSSKKRISTHFFLKISAAVGLGFGMTSCAYFLTLLTLGPKIHGVIIYDAGLFICLALFFVLHGKTRISSEKQVAYEKTLDDNKLRRILSIGSYSVFVLAFANLVCRAILLPHGTWDAWAIWNFRARFIFRGGEYWRDAFSSFLPSMYHTDYPLLIPLTISRCWTYIGKETLAVPVAISLLFTFAIVVMTYSALSILRSTIQGILASLVLLSTVLFIELGTFQQADIPTAFFFLGGVVFLFLQERYPEKYGLSFLSGTMAGLAGWTKNEGLLFLVSFFIARIIAIFLSQSRKMQMKQLMYFALGSMPVLAIIILFKVNFASSNDIVSSGRDIGEIILKVTDYARYVQILKGFITGILFTLPQVLLLLLYPLYVGIRFVDIRKIDRFMALLILILTLLGYFFVYLVTPNDLNWQMECSMHRLLIQLWPSLLLTYFMMIATPEDMVMNSQNKMCSAIR
jgi:hypothetical protein